MVLFFFKLCTRRVFLLMRRNCSCNCTVMISDSYLPSANLQSAKQLELVATGVANGQLP